MNRYKVLVADGLAKEGLSLLKANPAIELMEYTAIERDELKEKMPVVDILIVRSRTTVDKDLLENARNLKIVLRAGIGLDNIDVPAATDRGVVAMNAPTGNIVTTAEHTLAMIFAATRHIPQADASMRSGKWEKKKFQGNELRGKTLGLLGLGNIGKTVASRALALGMSVVGYDPYVSAEAAAKQNIRLLTQDEVLKESDYVSVHVPLIPSTKNLINKLAFSKMKKGAYLINCARGGIVDELALAEALTSGHLNGAALDVFETEPLPADSPLLKCPNLVITPHLGASTDEAQVQVSLEVAEQIGTYIRDGVLKNAVNVPNISLDQLSVLKPYITLCERIGSFAAQIGSSQNVKKIRVQYGGAITEYNREILTISVLKGFLAPLLSTPVNFVNARKLLKERGISVQESFEQECEDYTSLVELTVEGTETLSVSGTLFGKGEPRIVSIDHFKIDAIPEGFLLFTKNVDQPGVVGAMGTMLGSQGVNIARMHLGRDSKKAIALINIDSEPSEKTLETLRKTPGMLSVKAIRL
jgi:D-3-phosphoglycerate dehydrogenase / 2-oxoglutarate reductase